MTTGQSVETLDFPTERANSLSSYALTYVALRVGHPGAADSHARISRAAANLHTKILDLRGVDPSRILILRGGILTSIGNFPAWRSGPDPDGSRRSKVRKAHRGRVIIY